MSLVTDVLDAVKSGDEDLTLSRLVVLELPRSAAHAETIVSDEIFGGMLRALSEARALENHCGFHVFSWLTDHYGKLDAKMREEMKDFVAENFQKFHEGTVLLLMAEWAGGIGGDWSLSVIERWISLPPDSKAFSFVDEALNDFFQYGLASDKDKERLSARASALRSTYEEIKSRNTTHASQSI